MSCICLDGRNRKARTTVYRAIKYLEDNDLLMSVKFGNSKGYALNGDYVWKTFHHQGRYGVFENAKALASKEENKKMIAKLNHVFERMNKLTKRGFAPLNPQSRRQAEGKNSFFPSPQILSSFYFHQGQVRFAHLLSQNLDKNFIRKKAIIRFHRFDRTTKILSIRNMRCKQRKYSLVISC